VSRSFHLVVEKATTTLSLRLDPAAAAVVGQAVAATPTLTPQGGGSPTGSVVVTDGLTSCSVPASAGGSCAVAFPTAGTRAVTATYGGDSTFLGSTTAQSYTVNPAPTATTVVSSANPSLSGLGVTFTATVTAVPPGAGTPSGTVSFADGATPLGTVPLVAGVVSFTASGLALGSHSITATYSGDGNYLTSSGTVAQQVSQAGTQTSLASSKNPSSTGEPVTLTATVAVLAPGTGTPTGGVTFLDGSTELGTATLNAAGTAAFTTTTLAIGSHSITAAYSGDTNFNASTSPALTQTVNGPSFTFVGFLTPLTTAGSLGSPTYSGTQSFGSAIPVKWQLKDASGASVEDLSSARSLRAISNADSRCRQAPAPGAASTLLYSPTSGAKGNSTFRYGSNQYIFNWDTASTVAKGCYTLALELSDGQLKATNVLLR
jgi:hypothetical protein